jgi:hypothetical protein
MDNSGVAKPQIVRHAVVLFMFTLLVTECHATTVVVITTERGMIVATDSKFVLTRDSAEKLSPAFTTS